VEGEPGVGKTTFINRLKTELAHHGVLTHSEPVRVTPSMQPWDFIAEVLKVLLQIHATSQAVGSEGPRGMLRRGLQTVQDETGLKDSAAFWRRISRLIAGEDSIAIGVAGVSRERVRIPAEVKVSLMDELGEALRHLAGSDGRRILIHVNNLETLSATDTASAALMFQGLRDAFLFDGGHWLFVGTTGIGDSLFRATQQVGSIIGAETRLGPLAADEVAEMLRRRYEYLRLDSVSDSLVSPIAPDVGASLCGRFHGHLRAFLALASRAVQRSAIASPGKPLSEADVIALMQADYMATVMKRVSGADFGHLEVTVGGRHAASEFRVKDIAAAAGITTASASASIRRMLAVGVIALTRSEGRSNYYQVRDGDTSVALGMV
jgi:hypothetical protein